MQGPQGMDWIPPWIVLFPFLKILHGDLYCEAETITYFPLLFVMAAVTPLQHVGLHPNIDVNGTLLSSFIEHCFYAGGTITSYDFISH